MDLVAIADPDSLPVPDPDPVLEPDHQAGGGGGAEGRDPYKEIT